MPSDVFRSVLDRARQRLMLESADAGDFHDQADFLYQGVSESTSPSHFKSTRQASR